MAIGYLFGTKDIVGTKKTLSTHASVKKLDRLISYLSEDYVDKINSDSLVREIIEDIVDELDPHSIYIPAVQKQDLAESMQGNFHGLGVSFFMVEHSIAVVRVLEGGPSQKAGLKSGDRILIANQDTLYQKGFTSTEVVSKLKGKSEIPLKLSVYRKKTDSIYEFNIVRGPVPIPSVSSSYMLNETTGYLKINRFSQTTYEEFSSSLKSLVNQDLKNLIIDLRGNPGGYLLPAKQIVDDFLSAGEPIVIVEGNNGSRQKTVASASGLFETGRLYVLVDENSASASEVIAGAIQDNDRGWIIGRRTFGKGLVQQQMPLGGGDQIRLTTARYFTPTGRSIQRPYDMSSKEDYYAEVQERFRSGEMKNPNKIPQNDSLAFKTPKGRTVYGGGGITPDFYISNDETPEEAWNNYLIRSNYVNRFVFNELDKNFQKYNFDNAARFFNEPLPESEEFIKSFEAYCLENNLQLKSQDNDKVLNSIKAFIAIQLFNENMYTRIINQQDVFIKRALSEMEAN